MRKEYSLCLREGKYYCLTIPAEFVKKNNLKLSDRLYVSVSKDYKLWVFSKQIFIEPFYKYKLSRRGKRGWVISLPESWVLIINGKKGDILNYIMDENNNLIIEKKGEKDDKNKQVI